MRLFKKKKKTVPTEIVQATILKTENYRDYDFDDWGNTFPIVSYKTTLKLPDGMVDTVGVYCGKVGGKIKCDWYQVEKYGRLFPKKYKRYL